MKTFRFILILLFTAFLGQKAVAQSEGFYHEFPIAFNDTVSMFFQQNTVQISDTTFFTSGNYGLSLTFEKAGIIISDTSGAILTAKYIDHERSFSPKDIIKIDNNKIIYCGSFDLYDEITGSFKDKAAGLLCVDFEGNVLWEKYYGEIMPSGGQYTSYYDEDFLTIVKDEANQKLYCLGVAFSYDDEHEGKPYVVCTDYSGDTVWTWVMPDLVNQNMGLFTDAVVTENGDLICVGQIGIHEDKGYNGKNLIVKLSAEGEQVWSKLWGITNVYSAGVVNIGNDEFVVAAEESEVFLDTITYGTIYKFNGDGDSISKTSFLRNLMYIWVKDIVPTSGGFAILGVVSVTNNNESSVIFVAKYDYNLSTVSIKGYGLNLDFKGVSNSYDNSLLLTGRDDSEYGNFVIKTDSLLNIPLPEIDLFIPVSQRLREISYYPNPVSDLLYIESQGNETVKEIKIYDIYGRVILTKKTSESQIIIDVSGIENGLYILETDNVYSGKIVIQN